VRTILYDLSILATEKQERGIGRHVAELALALQETREVRVLYLEGIEWNGKARIEDDAAGAITRLTDPGAPPAGRWSWAYRQRLGLAQASNRAGADVLHLPQANTTPLFATKARRIVTCHDLIPLRYPAHYRRWSEGFWPGRYLLDKRRYGSADHVIAISQATRDDLMDILRIDANRITVVHNGIDLKQWRSLTDPGDNDRLTMIGVRPQGYLVYAGDADWRKNHRGMFAALAIIRCRFPDIMLVCVGKLSEARQSMLRKEARAAGVGDGLCLAGYVQDDTLKALYRHALATLYVSFAEGFGLPVLEAMASGCPVVTSNCSGMAEVGDGAALLVHPRKPDDIAAAVETIGSDSRIRSELTAKGLERARCFTIERQARQTIAVYQAV